MRHLLPEVNKEKSSLAAAEVIYNQKMYIPGFGYPSEGRTRKKVRFYGEEETLLSQRPHEKAARTQRYIKSLQNRNEKSRKVKSAALSTAEERLPIEHFHHNQLQELFRIYAEQSTESFRRAANPDKSVHLPPLPALTGVTRAISQFHGRKKSKENIENKQRHHVQSHVKGHISKMSKDKSASPAIRTPSTVNGRKSLSGELHLPDINAGK